MNTNAISMTMKMQPTTMPTIAPVFLLKSERENTLYIYTYLRIHLKGYLLKLLVIKYAVYQLQTISN